MSGTYMSYEKKTPEIFIPKEIDKIVITLETLKAILKNRYNRDIEKITFDEREGYLIIDFVDINENTEKDPNKT